MVWSCSLNLLLLAGFLPKVEGRSSPFDGRSSPKNTSKFEVFLIRILHSSFVNVPLNSPEHILIGTCIGAFHASYSAEYLMMLHSFMEPHAPGRKTDADLHVLQSPPSLVLTKGDQAILNCSFPAGDPNGKGAVSWNRFSLEEDRSSGRAISLGGHFSLAYPRTSLGKGDGSLIISNISWEDAGIYVCKVWLWGKEEKEGHPNQPEIYLQVQGQKEGTIVLACRTFGFHPAPVNFSWHSSDLSITALGPAELWKSESGDFQSIHYVAIPCSSTWKTFTCSVRHVSLVEPLSSNYTYDPGEHGLSGNQLMEYLNIIKICLVLGLLMSITLTGRGIDVALVNLHLVKCNDGYKSFAGEFSLLMEFAFLCQWFTEGDRMPVYEL
ncbi:hypothetical protein XELAEV_18036328mg [Xenopus laevis]|uniref:Ig-like domain-containing protein n=1 Tax=Xenopus laevis TaxID=8355 RepID=A0A974CJF4_XENLA|nr:hypothetical protein XELAEV_18036328mg [Xenopus laevis]